MVLQNLSCLKTLLNEIRNYHRVLHLPAQVAVHLMGRTFQMIENYLLAGTKQAGKLTKSPTETVKLKDGTS